MSQGPVPNQHGALCLMNHVSALRAARPPHRRNTPPTIGHGVVAGPQGIADPGRRLLDPLAVAS